MSRPAPTHPAHLLTTVTWSQRVQYAVWILDFLKRERSWGTRRLPCRREFTNGLSPHSHTAAMPARAHLFQKAWARKVSNVLRGPQARNFGKGLEFGAHQ